MCCRQSQGLPAKTQMRPQVRRVNLPGGDAPHGRGEQAAQPGMDHVKVQTGCKQGQSEAGEWHAFAFFTFGQGECVPTEHYARNFAQVFELPLAFRLHPHNSRPAHPLNLSS